MSKQLTTNQGLILKRQASNVNDENINEKILHFEKLVVQKTNQINELEGQMKLKENYFQQCESDLQQNLNENLKLLNQISQPNFNSNSLEKQISQQSLKQQIDLTLDKVPDNLKETLLSQEQQLIHFYNKRINDLYKSFDDQYNDQVRQDQSLLNKESEILKQLEWVRNIALKIDNEHQELKEKLDEEKQLNFQLQLDNQECRQELFIIRSKIKQIKGEIQMPKEQQKAKEKLQKQKFRSLDKGLQKGEKQILSKFGNQQMVEQCFTKIKEKLVKKINQLEQLKNKYNGFLNEYQIDQQNKRQIYESLGIIYNLIYPEKEFPNVERAISDLEQLNIENFNVEIFIQDLVKELQIQKLFNQF